MYLCIVLIFNLIGCSNQKSNPDKQLPTDLSSVKAHSIFLDRKKVQLVETVLNLPDVIRFSKLEFIRKKYGKVYIFIGDNEGADSTPPIMQNGHSLSVLSSLDSITDTKPCYVFDKIEIRGDTASVRMRFDIT